MRITRRIIDDALSILRTKRSDFVCRAISRAMREAGASLEDLETAEVDIRMLLKADGISISGVWDGHCDSDAVRRAKRIEWLRSKRHLFPEN